MMLLQGRSARIFTLSLHDRRMLAGRSRGGGSVFMCVCADLDPEMWQVGCWR